VSSRVAEAVGRGTRVVALPNVLTFVRIALVPVLVLVLCVPTPVGRAVAGGCFLLACLTDFFDGWLARRHGLTTALGQLLDPLADKLIVAAALIMLAAVPPEPRVPAWIVVVIVLREIAVTGLRGIASTGGVLVPAQELGKYKMIFQMFALHGLLLHYTYVAIDFHLAGMYFLWISTVVSLWSGGLYVARVAREIRTQQRGSGAA
jgi:CDP-diacylglycerol--glycerol-3-phosphate 3-phosphatidyltransferase